MNNFDTIGIITENICCYGSEAPYDHPAVYLKIDPKTKETTCPYCSKKYQLQLIK